MGCNCGGSTPAQAAVQQEHAQREQAAQPPREPRKGLPGEPGYVWTGPQTSKTA